MEELLSLPIKMIGAVLSPTSEEKTADLVGNTLADNKRIREIRRFIEEKMKEQPVFPWEKLKEFAVFYRAEIWALCALTGAGRDGEQERLVGKACDDLGIDAGTAQGCTVREAMEQLFSLMDGELMQSLSDETKLLLSTVQDSVHHGFYDYIKGLQLPPEVTQNTFHYRYRLPLCGRKAEIERLEAFRTAEDREGILFWALTAPGGSGKSKLVYEYMKERREKESDWLFVWGTKEVLEQIGSYDNWHSPKKLFLAVDYANSSSEELKTWLKRLFQAREEKRPASLRLLLIERHGRTKRPGFDSLQDPLWLESFCRDEGIREHRYLGRSGELLELPGLDDTTAKEMMDRYAKSQGKPSLYDGKKTELIDRVRAMLPADEERKNECRPLFLLFATDAVLHGEDPRHWDLDSMLGYALKRNREYWERNIDPEIRSSLIALARYATIVGSYTPARNFPEPLKGDNQKIWEHFSHDPNACKQYFSVISERKLTEGTLYPLEPDLLGEYFVLSFLSEIDNPELLTEWRELLWREGNEPGLMDFFSRCADDFAGNEAYIELLFSLLPEAEKVGEEQAVDVAEILFHFTIRQSEKVCKRAVDALEALSMRFSDFDFFAHAYASGLVNLTAVQDLTGSEDSVGKLQEVYDCFPDNREIALQYAKGLVNLTAEQDLTGCEASVGKLREVYARFPDNGEIAEAYAMGLFNLAAEQDLAGREDSAGKLREVYARFPDNAGIAEAYAKGLVNLTAVQDLAGCEDSVGKLREVYARFRDNEEIALRYASGLVNLAVEQDLAGREASVGELREVYARLPDNGEIALQYARGLGALWISQPKEEREGTLLKIKELRDRFPENKRIAEVYQLISSIG